MKQTKAEFHTVPTTYNNIAPPLMGFIPCNHSSVLPTFSNDYQRATLPSILYPLKSSVAHHKTSISKNQFTLFPSLHDSQCFKALGVCTVHDTGYHFSWFPPQAVCYYLSNSKSTDGVHVHFKRTKLNSL